MILAVDTSGDRCVVALADADGNPHYCGTGALPRAHAEELAPLVADALRVGPVSAVVAGRGPGSFTGLRVGLAFATMFGWARQLPVSGLCSLDPVATAAGLDDGWVVIDARRGELFAAQYRAGIRSEAPVVLPRAEIAELIGVELVSAGPIGAEPIGAELAGGGRAVGDVELLASEERRARGTTVIDPAALAVCAARSVADGSTGSLQPDYLRRPDVTWSAAHGRQG